jgi:L-lactate dehydrogenase complex protein LldG
MNTRAAFLQRVRQAVTEGNRPGQTHDLPARGSLGYQGAGPDPLARFCEELKNAGGFPHVANDADQAWQIIRELIDAKQARKIVIGEGGVIERLGIADRLRPLNLEVRAVDSLQLPQARDVFFQADIGISNVAHLIAETGSVIMATAPADPRSLSLLPPVHIAVADQSQLLPDLFDLFDLFSPLGSPGKVPPSCLTIITGPSKTGDIELRLVTGVHGPGEIHVVVV